MNEQKMNSLNTINKLDLQLWRRFVVSAQPYWYPVKRGGGWIFFGLLIMLLVFILTALLVAVSLVIRIGQQCFPELVKNLAPGLAEMSGLIIGSPAIYGVGLALLIPLISFALCRKSLQTRWRQWIFLALLLLLSLSVSGLNVIISFVIRFIDTGLAQKDAATFWRFLFVFGGVFVVGTPIVVIYRYIQQLLGLYWRDWLTKEFLYSNPK